MSRFCPMAPLGLPLRHKWREVRYDKFGTGRLGGSYEKCARCIATRGVEQPRSEGLVSVTFPKFSKQPDGYFGYAACWRLYRTEGEDWRRCRMPQGHDGECQG